MSEFIHVQYQWDSSLGNIIYEVSNTIQFNNILKKSDNVEIDLETGIITFNRTGTYQIDWSVVIQSAGTITIPIALALVSSKSDYIIGDTNQRQGVVSGSAILSVDEPGMTIHLINEAVRVTMGGLPIIANLTANSIINTCGGTEMALSVLPLTLLDTNDNFVFNLSLYDDNPNVTYDGTTGEFTLWKAGGYLINWWADIANTAAIGAVDSSYISVLVNGRIHSSVAFDSQSFIGKQVSGSSFVLVANEAVVVKLTNTTPEAGFHMGKGKLQAGILITQLTGY